MNQNRCKKRHLDGPGGFVEPSWILFKKARGGLFVLERPLGRLCRPGAPKSFRNAFWSDHFGSHFGTKVGKVAFKKASQNLYQTNIEKVCQKASEIMRKWRDESVIAHAPEKKVKNEKLLVFPIENVVWTM